MYSIRLWTLAFECLLQSLLQFPPDNQRTRFRETDLPVPARRVLTLAVCTLDTEEHGRKTSHSPAASEEGALWRVFGRGLRVFDT